MLGSRCWKFPLGLAVLFGLALALRWWGLGRFNTQVFDEVYYVRFAVDYLRHTPFFDAHPPLGKYLIAVGIGLVNPLVQQFGLVGNTLAEMWLSPVSYRWMNGLVGATIPVLVALLAEGISDGHPPALRRTFGLVAGGLMAMEGLALVESRYGLINIYWVFFGVLGQVCWVRSHHHPPRDRWGLRLLAGLALGAAISVKWNGAGFLLGIYLLWGLSRLGNTQFRAIPSGIREFSLVELLVYGGVVPLVTYGLLWIPHLTIAQTSFGAVHASLWQAHQAIGGQENVHPYCSRWYTWPLMLRPVAYFFQTGGNPEIGIPSTAPPLVYSVQGMGNPILWWFSTAGVIALLGKLLTNPLGRWRETQMLSRQRVFRRMVSQRMPSRSTQLTEKATTRSGQSIDPVAVFLLVNYGANWLPWMAVQRCTFLYHYMGAGVFSGLAIAWLLARWLRDPRPWFRLPAWILLGLIGAGFGFWLPIYLGLPLSPEQLGWRWWLRSWI